MDKAPEEQTLDISLDDLDRLNPSISNEDEMKKAVDKYSTYFQMSMNNLKKETRMEGNQNVTSTFHKLDDVITKAWAIPIYGYELGTALCNSLRRSGGLDLILHVCRKSDPDQQFSSIKLLEQCLITDNRTLVIENGLDDIINVVCDCTRNANSDDYTRVGTGILEQLFKHNDRACGTILRLGGLDVLLEQCRRTDSETLSHCAAAFANLGIYSGAENKTVMIKKNVPMWLFPLAFHTDDNIKYFAYLAVTALTVNAEMEARILQSGCLELVARFVATYNPSEFAKLKFSHYNGQSKAWLQKFVPVLNSKRDEARSLAAFHFCMEVNIKKQQGNINIFSEIDAIEPLKSVAGSLNPIASNFAAQALELIGEEIPYRLSNQVPLWSSNDVSEWVKRIGFAEIASTFSDNKVDGDLLFQLTEDCLRDDIGLKSGIHRKRFLRELNNLKRTADYGSRDPDNINGFLRFVDPEFSVYTYSFLNAGIITKTFLRNIWEGQLLHECGITNSIHRYKIMEGISQLNQDLPPQNLIKPKPVEKTLDVFISYRRSNGSHLASLLKVHLQLRNFSVFLDVETLEAGKFDENLLLNIKKSKNFLLVLTCNALDRCIQDHEEKDWIRKEIIQALASTCNIIPIIDDFKFPKPEELPEDIRHICSFNGVYWVHDYQDACVEKVERFMVGNLDLSGSP